MKFGTRRFGIFIKGTAKSQGMTSGNGVQLLKNNGFYTNPKRISW